MRDRESDPIQPLCVCASCLIVAEQAEEVGWQPCGLLLDSTAVARQVLGHGWDGCGNLEVQVCGAPPTPSPRLVAGALLGLLLG